MSDTDTWYYVQSGERIGPTSLEKLRRLATEGKISGETKVWRGAGEWTAAKNTELRESFAESESPAGPPPLGAGDVDNRFVWAAAVVPLVGSFIELLVAKQLILLYVLLNVCCCTLDEKKLKAAGHKTPSAWWALLVPVYLWKRATQLGQRRHYFWAWCAAFVLSGVVSVAGHELLLEESAIPLVSQIIREQRGDSVTCVKVTIDETVRDGFHLATATLNTGAVVKIIVEEMQGGQIRVSLAGR
jgi:hypothetical protein